MKNILFVCTGNTCRSPMAEALFRHHEENNEWTARSAGLYADSGSPASTHAIAVLNEQGIDLKKHRSSPLTHELIQQADLIVTMTEGHRSALLQIQPDIANKVCLLKSFESSMVSPDITDPFGGSLTDYKIIRDEIDLALSELFRFIHTKNI